MTDNTEDAALNVVKRLRGLRTPLFEHAAGTIEALLARATTAEAQAAALREALQSAEPYVELAHSTAQAKDVRAMVWKRLKQVRAALASAETQEKVDG